jgi:hypothetical protein
MRWLKHLWFKAFPVRVVLVYQERPAVMPSAFNDRGEMEQFDAMLPELVGAYDSCAPMFKWLAMELARKDKEYHAPPPADAAEYALWKRNIERLNGQLAALNIAIRVPHIATRRLAHLQELAKNKTATDAERKAIADFFTE